MADVGSAEWYRDVLPATPTGDKNEEMEEMGHNAEGMRGVCELMAAVLGNPDPGALAVAMELGIRSERARQMEEAVHGG